MAKDSRKQSVVKSTMKDTHHDARINEGHEAPQEGVLGGSASTIIGLLHNVFNRCVRRWCRKDMVSRHGMGELRRSEVTPL
jgi:hypothetical protein